MSRYFYYILLPLVVSACKKEATLQPSNKEESYLVVKDNPSDPVDHAIYQFYKETDIPVYYTDTIGKRQVRDNAGQATYFYDKLAINYSPGGIDMQLYFERLSDKTKVLPMLPLLQEDLLPRLPETIPLFSILLVDSIQFNGDGAQGRAISSNKPYIGFNTILLKAVDADTMQAENKKRYTASILARLALKKLGLNDNKWINDFYNISKSNFPSTNVYINLLFVLSPDGLLKIEDFGFIITYPGFDFATPGQQDDLVSYLEAVFFYDTPAEFNSLYPNYPLVLEKFTMVRDKMKEFGFTLSD